VEWIWMIAVALAACGGQPRAPVVADDPDAAPPVTAIDITVLRRASELLADESRWNRHDDRQCPPHAQIWSLYCAIHDAQIAVTGVFAHRSAAMQEVRHTVEQATVGIELQHRMMDYNNLPTTTFRDIKAILKTTIDRISPPAH
jgi:hypothetical protein